jgi:transcriptional regulator with XRE-family HTH domain
MTNKVEKTVPMNPDELRRQRCERALAVRKRLLDKSRKYIAEKYRLKESMIQSWETNLRGSGMSDNSARTLAQIYQAEGLNVTAEWLMYGIGEPPTGLSALLEDADSSRDVTPEANIIQELKLFYHLNNKATHHIIQDDALAPWLVHGDYVAGSWLFELPKTMVNYPVIVNVGADEITARLLSVDAENRTYCLTCSNAHSAIPEMRLKQRGLFAVAPIMWIRKIKMNSGF